jgi:hypothetical protein
MNIHRTSFNAELTPANLPQNILDMNLTQLSPNLYAEYTNLPNSFAPAGEVYLFWKQRQFAKKFTIFEEILNMLSIPHMNSDVTKAVDLWTTSILEEFAQNNAGNVFFTMI